VTQFFPTQKSTLSTHAIREHVKHTYNLAEPLRCRLFSQTFNDMYLIQTEDNLFIYRVWGQTTSTKDSIEGILEIQAQLAKKGLSVVQPVPLIAGSYVESLAALEGARLASLFTYAKGQPAGRAITPEQSFIVGQLTANFHMITEGFAAFPKLLVHDENFLLIEPSEVILNSEVISTEQQHMLCNIIESLGKQLSQLELTSPFFGICHGDIHGMNVLFHGTDITLIDFDWLSYGWRSWDLAVFLWWIRGVKHETSVKQSFLEGYQSIYPKAEIIIQHIPIFVPIRHLLLTSGIIKYAKQGMDVGRWIDEAFIDKRLTFMQNYMQEHGLFD